MPPKGKSKKAADPAPPAPPADPPAAPKPAPPPEGVTEQDKYLLDVVDWVGKEDPWYHVDYTMLAGENDVTAGDLPIWGPKYWSEWKGLFDTPPKRQILGWFHHNEDSEKESTLIGQTVRSFLPGRMVHSNDFMGDDETVMRWSRGDSDLVRDDEMQMRHEGEDFLFFGPHTAFWPPPLAPPFKGNRGARSSQCWFVAFPKEVTKEQLLAASEEIFSGDAFAWFRALNKKGEGLRHFWLRLDKLITASEPKDFDFEIGGDTLLAKYAPRCSACLKGAPFSVSHEHTQCPLLGTMNKIRSHAGVIPIVVEDGRWQRTDSKIPLDLEKELTELKAVVLELKVEVDKLKSASTSQSKKRKADQAETQSPGAPPAKKGKKEEGGGAQAQGAPSG
ncbi:hypothetical protein BJ138DRAFT_1131582, partial [Hygrophoropsis aurantiaca]